MERPLVAEHSLRVSEELLGSQDLRFSMLERGDITHIKLFGFINEKNQLRLMSRRIRTSHVVLDVGGVDRINSCGVRDWVTWLHDIEARNTRVVLTACSLAIVSQLNMVFNFVGKSIVASFYAPFYCEDCDMDRVKLFMRTDIGPPPYEIPIQRCDTCDMVMEFDDVPEIFFGFLARQPVLEEIDWYQQSMLEEPEATREEWVVPND